MSLFSKDFKTFVGIYFMFFADREDYLAFASGISQEENYTCSVPVIIAMKRSILPKGAVWIITGSLQTPFVHCLCK